MPIVTPILIIDLDARSPLHSFLSPASIARVFAGGLPAELVGGVGGGNPTAIRYCGEAWALTGVRWTAAPVAPVAYANRLGEPSTKAEQECDAYDAEQRRAPAAS